MNKNIKLAVAGAVLALSASANAGIIIPAGDWTLDINGNVNAFANYTHAKAGTAGTAASTSSFVDEFGDFSAGIKDEVRHLHTEDPSNGYQYNNAAPVTGGLAASPTGAKYGTKSVGINTGLLPSWLGFTGTTRQNDVDVSFTMSMQPNVSDNSAAGDAKTPLFRQAFLTFGDKSWGSFKLGKDIGIFASDAILNDMTLLGVGGGAGISGASTTLGGIGSGYIYAAWKGQVAYTTPNFNGFQATVGITNPNQQPNAVGNQDRFGLEGKVSYDIKQDGFSGKVWASGASYDVTNGATSYTVSVGDIGAHVDAGAFGVTGYYYGGKGAGTTILGSNGTATTYNYQDVQNTDGTHSLVQTAVGSTNRRDSDGGYVQLTYATPIKTKIGVAYGISNLDLASGEIAAENNTVKSNERWTVGLYHPLTKHLNLVAEYNNIQSEAHDGTKAESDTYSAGAILFF